MIDNRFKKFNWKCENGSDHFSKDDERHHFFIFCHWSFSFCCRIPFIHRIYIWIRLCYISVFVIHLNKKSFFILLRDRSLDIYGLFLRSPRIEILRKIMDVDNLFEKLVIMINSSTRSQRDRKISFSLTFIFRKSVIHNCHSLSSISQRNYSST